MIRHYDRYNGLTKLYSEKEERKLMGIADAFNREDRVEIKVVSFIGMTQVAAKAEAMSALLMNAVNCEVPYRYIREIMTGVSECPIAAPEQEEGRNIPEEAGKDE